MLQPDADLRYFTQTANVKERQKEKSQRLKAIFTLFGSATSVTFVIPNYRYAFLQKRTN